MYSKTALLNELYFKAIRSSGSGGQHVNKVASKVELHFDVTNSSVIEDEVKDRIKQKLKHRLTKDGKLVLQCDTSRSQHKNKELVIKRFFNLIETAVIRPKKRKSTKPPKSAIKKRLKNKRIQAEKKTSRKNPNLD